MPASGYVTASAQLAASRPTSNSTLSPPLSQRPHLDTWYNVCNSHGLGSLPMSLWLFFDVGPRSQMTAKAASNAHCCLDQDRGSPCEGRGALPLLSSRCRSSARTPCLARLKSSGSSLPSHRDPLLLPMEYLNMVIRVSRCSSRRLWQTLCLVDELACLACLSGQASESCVLRLNLCEREVLRTRTRIQAGQAASKIDAALQNSSVGLTETQTYVAFPVRTLHIGRHGETNG